MELGEGVDRPRRSATTSSLVFVPSCGHCVPCSEGRPALCEPGAAANGAGTLLSGARRLSQADGEPINHHLGCSAFAEHAVVSRRSLVKLDPALPFDEAALFGCAVLTGVGAVVNTAQVRAGQSVAVIGLGGVGLAARDRRGRGRRAGRSSPSTCRHAKRETALSLGATHGLRRRRRPTCVEQIRAATQGRRRLRLRVRRLDARVRDGLPDHAARRHHRDGRPAAAERDVRRCRWSTSSPRSARVKGSYIGTCVPTRDLPRYVSLYRSGRLPVDRLMSGRLTLDQINEGFDLLHEGKAIRQVVVFP